MDLFVPIRSTLGRNRRQTVSRHADHQQASRDSRQDAKGPFHGMLHPRFWQDRTWLVKLSAPAIIRNCRDWHPRPRRQVLLQIAGERFEEVALVFSPSLMAWVRFG